MIIVGSRCGGFEFYACLIGLKDPIYLGPRKTSDLDLLLLEGESLPISEYRIEPRYLKKESYYQHEKKAIFQGIEVPFFTTKLNMPEKNNFLKFNIIKRARAINPEIVWQNKNKTIPILDKNLKQFDYIIL